MITREDMRGYLDNLSKFEVNAERNYKELQQEVGDERIKKELGTLVSDEQNHIQRLLRLRKLFEDD